MYQEPVHGTLDQSRTILCNFSFSPSCLPVVKSVCSLELDHAITLVCPPAKKELYRITNTFM